MSDLNGGQKEAQSVREANNINKRSHLRRHSQGHTPAAARAAEAHRRPPDLCDPRAGRLLRSTADSYTCTPVI